MTDIIMDNNEAGLRAKREAYLETLQSYVNDLNYYVGLSESTMTYHMLVDRLLAKIERIDKSLEILRKEKKWWVVKQLVNITKLVVTKKIAKIARATKKKRKQGDKIMRDDKAKIIRQARRNANKAKDKFFSSGNSIDAIDFLLRQDLLANAYNNDSMKYYTM